MVCERLMGWKLRKRQHVSMYYTQSRTLFVGGSCLICGSRVALVLTVGLLQRELVVDGGESVVVRHLDRTSVRCSIKHDSQVSQHASAGDGGTKKQ